jgi:hypothetical protein
VSRAMRVMGTSYFETSGGGVVGWGQRQLAAAGS